MNTPKSISSVMDEWFSNHPNIYKSQLSLLALTMQDSEETILSFGTICGIFEIGLEKEYNIKITNTVGNDPMGIELAKQRGLNAQLIDFKNFDLGNEMYDCIYLHRTTMFIENLKYVVSQIHKALKPNGKIVILDIPKESALGILYTHIKTIGGWTDELGENVAPDAPLPYEILQSTYFSTVEYKISLLSELGFSNFSFAQTMTKHPRYNERREEEPSEGYENGNFIAITAMKK